MVVDVDGKLIKVHNILNYAIALDIYKSKIYVLSVDQCIHEINVYDIGDGKLISKIECTEIHCTNTESHTFCSITCSMTIYDSNIFIPVKGCKIYVYSLRGKLLNTINFANVITGNVNQIIPMDISIYDDNIYLSLRPKNEIVCISLEGNHKFAIDSEILTGTCTVHATDYSLFVSDLCFINQFDRKGVFMKKWDPTKNSPMTANGEIYSMIVGIAFLGNKCFVARESINEKYVYILK